MRKAPVKANFLPIVIFDWRKFFFLPVKAYKLSIGKQRPNFSGKRNRNWKFAGRSHTAEKTDPEIPGAWQQQRAGGAPVDKKFTNW